jgi:hypothetical protein
MIRKQLDPRDRFQQLDLDRLIDLSSHLLINGQAIHTHWECDLRIHDDDAVEVMGATEFDPSCPGAVMVYVNGKIIGQQVQLLRSTASHELAHVVYDAPAWLRNQQLAPKRLQYRIQPQARRTAGDVDWREWRANEFMGALLVPPDRLRKAFIKHAITNNFGLIAAAGQGPAVKAASADPHRMDAILEELGELFGVSPKFVEVRIKKYGLIR